MSKTKRAVWTDTDDKRRREFWTDGEWIKVGRDVDDPSLCLTFRYEDDHYEQFRRGDHPFKITIEDDRGSNETYLVDCRSMGEYRFFKGQNLVLQVNDHELRTIRAAYREAGKLRKAEYEYPDTARSYIRSLFPSTIMFEITELKVDEEKPRGNVLVGHTTEATHINEGFMSNVKDAEFAEWMGVYHKKEFNSNDGGCEGFRYAFTVDAEAIRTEEQ